MIKSKVAVHSCSDHEINFYIHAFLSYLSNIADDSMLKENHLEFFQRKISCLPTSNYIYLNLTKSTYIYLLLPTSTFIYLLLPTSVACTLFDKDRMYWQTHPHPRFICSAFPVTTHFWGSTLFNLFVLFHEVKNFTDTPALSACIAYWWIFTKFLIKDVN